MFCPNCGNERNEKSRYCQHCGNKQKQHFSIVMILFMSLLVSASIVGAVYLATTNTGNKESPVASDNATIEKTQLTSKQPIEVPIMEKKDLKEDKNRELTDIIAAAQETVYTVITNYNQGSGFLYNNNGAVVTNAHVVEGETSVFIKTVNGQDLPGTVIGYSNETDVAVILVPDLVGREPFSLEKASPVKIGEEIIALGSPLGLENTATMGYVTGQDRSFFIGSFTYENLYQISAPISPGSSGGPLIAKASEKIIAINSAESQGDSSIGFSIPLFQIAELIQSWIDQPMSEEAILAQFYDANDEYYYDDLWSYYEDGYFDGGDYSEENAYYDYWEYYWEDESYYNDYYDEGYEEDYGYAEDEYYDDEGWYEEDEYYDNEEWYDEDEDWYYDELTETWYYYNVYEGTWYYYDEVEDLYYEVDESF
ncbi:trypsin-like peptidase domain-containing protein [Virgibacillus sp. C22-A2]|uniref:Trypsin-like peptidase domain-containing protein n=1 Tax=Virgibacillus tibetensis TaxID=3042313 RepID=A0ABU6KD66_9BACI|nr:trypsin-like peptidase domain-containing protein [Virgibacillus sp. C22-A2]